MKKTPFNSTLMKLFMAFYRFAGFILLPILLVYLWWRGRKDPLYTEHLGERFGFYRHTTTNNNTVWVHAVSLGELRSAVPLIKALLQQGESVVTTHFTPVGRREAINTFSKEIENGQLLVVYVPLEFDFAFQRFYKTLQPKYGLVMEVEYWPCMIASARRAGIPLFLCNGQYPTRSFDRDTKGIGLRSRLVSGFAGVMVKSDLQAQRFRSLGVSNVAITGELRFDQPIPQNQLHAADKLLTQLHQTSQIITIASAVEGEDDGYIETILSIRQFAQSNKTLPVLFVYVPRAPERFNDVKALLENAGLSVATRSTLLNEALECQHKPEAFDVLLGDSMGEMYFYLKLATQVIGGGGFTPNGAHNISEALALDKPVLVGPTLWTIEYPAMEAIEAGVVNSVENTGALISVIEHTLTEQPAVNAQQVRDFFAQHTGAIDKTLTAIPQLLANTTGGKPAA
jgi:3-deoxy-D-manno-octulosonic-acid transferase